jgi:hypothetical protein
MNKKNEKSQQETAAGQRRPGRETGVLMPGSIVAQIAELQPDEFLIFPDTPNRAQQLNTAIRRFQKVHDGGEYAVQLCIGNTIDLTTMPFRFYRLTRTA